jgi:hypothetical protein
MPRALRGNRRRCPGALPAQARPRPPPDPVDPHSRLFTGPRAWDLAQKQPLTDDQPAEIRARIIERDRRSASHLAVHMLDGATLAHGLSDSPAGLLAWLLERWNAWSDNGGDLESVFTKDDLLTHATIYWVNNSIATSMRYYANANRYPWTLLVEGDAPISSSGLKVTLPPRGAAGTDRPPLPILLTPNPRSQPPGNGEAASSGKCVSALFS